MTAPPGSLLNGKTEWAEGGKLMAPWFNQFNLSRCLEIREKRFCYRCFVQGGGHMFQRDLLKTWYPSVLSLQLTASPPARTVAPAAGRIPACAARASRAPAVRRWLRSRCTSTPGAVWGAYSRGSTFSRRTNSAEGPQNRLSMLLRCRLHGLRPPGSQPTPCKCCPSVQQNNSWKLDLWSNVLWILAWTNQRLVMHLLFCSVSQIIGAQ